MESEYKTKDIGEAAGLICSSMKLLRLDRGRDNCWFVFSRGDKCKKISDLYFFEELKVNAREFYEALSRLKNRIFALE